MAIERSEHPVWIVYNEYRTARLNVKYYSRELKKVRKESILLQSFLAVTAPSSAIAGLWFWETELGNRIWQILGIGSAFAAVLLPFFSFPKRIEKVQKLLSGYKSLEYDYRLLVSKIELKRDFGIEERDIYNGLLDKGRSLFEIIDESDPSKRIIRKLQEEVNRELPCDNFFVPNM